MTIAPPEVVESRSGSRSLVAGLPTAQSIASTLPSLFQDDELCVRLTTAFDDALAPIVSTLDCFGAYLDPHLAPEDFVDWLAGWVGLETDETWPPDRRRLLVAEAIDLYRHRGTRSGLVRHVQLYTGTAPDVEENGACAWSREPNGPLPGSPAPHLKVRVELGAGEDRLAESVVERIVRNCRPAHVPHEVLFGPPPAPALHHGETTTAQASQIALPELDEIEAGDGEESDGGPSDGEGPVGESDQGSQPTDGTIERREANTSDGAAGGDQEGQSMPSTSSDGAESPAPRDDEPGTGEAGAPP